MVYLIYLTTVDPRQNLNIIVTSIVLCYNIYHKIYKRYMQYQLMSSDIAGSLGKYKWYSKKGGELGYLV
jgi:hypothetical protein